MQSRLSNLNTAGSLRLPHSWPAFFASSITSFSNGFRFPNCIDTRYSWSTSSLKLSICLLSPMRSSDLNLALSSSSFATWMQRLFSLQASFASRSSLIFSWARGSVRSPWLRLGQAFSMSYAASSWKSGRLLNSILASDASGSRTRGMKLSWSSSSYSFRFWRSSLSSILRFFL